MAYTVKQLAAMSGVSVRTLHFYDETGLLKPARHGANGYRLYEEPQLLLLQQILFYRELGFELKQIQTILSRADFEKVTALESHRNVLEKNLARMRTLMETINKTIEHLKGKTKMNSEEMFLGFRIAAGEDRFGEHIQVDGQPSDCKVSAHDTHGAMCAFELTGAMWSGPRHRHHDQDEWIYILEGELQFEVGEKRFRAAPGESVFIPRNVSHGWACENGERRIIDIYQPAGKMEEFYRELGKYNRKPYVHEVLSIDDFRQLFRDHGMDLTGPPLLGEWKVESGRIKEVG